MTPRIRTKQVSLREEIKIIHPAGWVLTAIVLLLWFALALPKILQKIASEPHPPPLAVIGSLMTFVGFFIAALILLIFYVNADLKRRGMNRVLWTLLVIFVPNGIGFIIYFFLRKPILQSCPKCSVNVQGDFAFCPSCGERLSESCPACKRVIETGWARCAYCGAGLRGELQNA